MNPGAKGLTAENRARGARHAATIRVPCPDCSAMLRPCVVGRHRLAHHTDVEMPPLKRCSRCRVFKPAADYSAKAYHPSGRVRLLQSQCRECNTALNRERRQSPAERARRARYFQRVRADPERYAELLDRKRQWLRVRNQVEPDAYRYRPAALEGDARGLVPNAPMRERYIALGIGATEMARRLGWTTTVNGARKPDDRRAARTLGVAIDTSHGCKHFRTEMQYGTAVAVAAALDMDPHEAGI